MFGYAYTHLNFWFKNQDLFKHLKEVLGNFKLKKYIYTYMMISNLPKSKM